MLRKHGNLLYNIHPPRIPVRAVEFSYTLGLGGISLGLFVVLALTGVLELFYYTPIPSEANDSVRVITHLVDFGWLIRGAHYWAGQLMVLSVSLHLCRVFVTGAAKASRRFNWVLGLLLLVLTLIMDFSGYVLRWDEATHWALVVGTNLVRETPFAGNLLYGWLVGGEVVGAPALLRFYGWHVLGLPLAASTVLVWHLWRIRRDGGISHPAPARGRTSEMVPRDALIRREMAAAVLVILLFVALSAAGNVPLGEVAETGAPAAGDVRAPWIFLGVQVLLQYAPALVAGILVPAAFLLALALLPYLEKGTAGVGVWCARERAPWLAIFGFLVVAIGGLLLWGLLTI